ncbi:MAG: hypothetical protein J6A25_13665, partial [Lachnospiraceae bacterium]|nr:hypothetical protein [Lachnospiraceae bacterium]
MEHIKLQIGAILVVLYILFIYLAERKRFNQKYSWAVFDGMILLGIVAIIFDGITAYTVNHLDSVNEVLNRVLHMLFLLSLDSFIFLLFIYMISITTGLPKQKAYRHLLFVPFLVNVIIVVVNMPSLEYRQGDITNYSMGVSAYTCFIMAGVYILLSLAIFLRRWRYIEKHKRMSIFTYLLVLAGITVFQMIYPQALISSLAVATIIVGMYINQENPSVEELSNYHKEMMMGFAVLV